jgi:pimeloyl-ACP methyl ester carboxylesterase
MRVLSARAYSDGPQPGWWLEGLRANFARGETLLAYRNELSGIGAETAPKPFDPRAIRVPTLILHGDDDRLASIEIARYLDSVIPDSTLVEVAGGSHMLPVTHAEWLAEQMVAFSATPDAGALDEP